MPTPPERCVTRAAGVRFFRGLQFRWFGRHVLSAWPMVATVDSGESGCRFALCRASSQFRWDCGVGEKEEYRQFSDQDNVENTSPPEAHHHPEHGPNGGHVVVLGDHAYHAELVFDPTTLNVSVYLLEHDMATATPVTDASMAVRNSKGPGQSR